MKSLGLTYCALTLGAAAALLTACGGSQPPNATPGTLQFAPTTPHGTKKSKTFDYTGGEQTFKVPAGVSAVTVTASGASGGRGHGRRPSGPGGLVAAAIPVTPGETLTVVVGGAGTPYQPGYNGGAPGGRAPTCSSTCGGGGGGASDVRQGGDTLDDRVVIAGGGGGQACCDGAAAQGGDGGGFVGGVGQNGVSEGSPHGGVKGGKGGKGGHPNHGGSGGKGGTGFYHYCTGTKGEDGILGNGGQGGTSCEAATGGGGGGGYYGGGGGGGGCGVCGQSASFSTGGGGGGGGSSYIETQATKITNRRGVATGNGQIILSWRK